MNQSEAFVNRRHEHNDKDDFRTPMYLINWMKSIYGHQLRDGACSEENKKGKPINLFGNYVIQNDEWIYINPPFDTPSIIKFIEASKKFQYNDLVYLLPNKLCQKQFCLNVNSYFDEIHFLGGRIDFESPYSVKGGTSMNGCFLGVIYSDVIKKNEYPIVYSHTLSEIKRSFKNE